MVRGEGKQQQTKHLDNETAGQAEVFRMIHPTAHTTAIKASVQHLQAQVRQAQTPTTAMTYLPGLQVHFPAGQ